MSALRYLPVEVIFFYHCAPVTSHPGLLLFHSDMHHGAIDANSITDRSCSLYRNVFAEPSITLPDPHKLLVVDVGLASILQRHVEQPFLATEDAYLFHVPYQLGTVPDYLAPVQADLPRLMLAKDEILLPPAKKSVKRYSAIPLFPIRLVDDVIPVDLRIRDPYDDEMTEVDRVCSEQAIDRLGLVRGMGGIQVSRRVFREIRDYAPLPYFRFTVVQI